jgi:cation:H+ antiporter
MIWVRFILSTACIVYGATQLAKYGDVIALRTRLGGMFIGTLLIAGTTSLPELMTSISSISQNIPDLAAGNLFGSNTFNMVLLAVLDIAGRNQRILRKATLKHALSGSLTVFMIGLVVFFTLANIEWQIGWIGVDSLVIIGGYILAIRLIHGNVSSISQPDPRALESEGVEHLSTGIIGFIVAAGVLVLATPIMVQSANSIAEITNLGATFIGSTLVAIVTSLPEVVTTFAAIKIGADDLAIGNLFGSNLFNMFAIGLTDVFYTKGRFLNVINPSFAVVGMLGLLMTGLGLIGNLAKLERRLWFIEIDALALVLVYIFSIWFLYFNR